MGNEQAKDFDQNYEDTEGAARQRRDSPNPGPAARQRPANRVSWEDSDDNIHPGVRDFGRDMREEWARQQQAEDAAAAQERRRLERVRWEKTQAELAARKNARDAADERKQWLRRMEAHRAEERARDEAVKRSAREKKVEIEKRRRAKEEARRRAEEARRRRAAAAEEAKRKAAARQAENEARRRAQERSAREAAAAREAARRRAEAHRRAEEAKRKAEEEARRRAGDGGGGGGGGLSEETRKQRAAFQRVRNLKTDEGAPVPGYSYLFEVVGGDGKTRAEQLAERMAQLSTRVVPGTTRYAPNDKRDRIDAARALLLLADAASPNIKVGSSLRRLIAREAARGDEAKANKYRYHYLMKMWHPDRVKGGEEIKAAGESALIANNFAVRLLSDAHDVLKVGWAGKPLIKGGAKTRRRRRRNRKRRGKKTTRARRGWRQRKKTKKRRKRRKTKRRR